MGKSEDAYERLYAEMGEEAFEIIVLCLTRGVSIDKAMDEALGEGSAAAARKALIEGGFSSHSGECDHPFMFKSMEECVASGQRCVCGNRQS